VDPDDEDDEEESEDDDVDPGALVKELEMDEPSEFFVPCLSTVHGTNIGWLCSNRRVASTRAKQENCASNTP
jgi:hypothetical protein